jgi:hypothetical protein
MVEHIQTIMNRLGDIGARSVVDSSDSYDWVEPTMLEPQTGVDKEHLVQGEA